MRAKNLILFGFFVFFSGAAQGTVSQAWWDICNACSTDMDFRTRAVQIPFPYDRVYISNSLSNETRRFQRSFIEDDFWGGPSLTIIANEEPLTAEEAQVFEEVIQNAEATFITISRDSLDFHSGLSGRDSVVGDLTTGRLSGGLLSGLQAYLRAQGYAGATSQVSSVTNIDVWVFSYNLNINPSDLRTHPLTVRINYPDGSSIQIEFDKDLTEVLSVSALDAEGNEIPFELSSTSTPGVTPVSGREYSFGTAEPEWVHDFRRALDGVDRYSCSAWTTEDFVVVLCVRP